MGLVLVVVVGMEYFFCFFIFCKETKKLATLFAKLEMQRQLKKFVTDRRAR